MMTEPPSEGPRPVPSPNEQPAGDSTDRNASSPKARSPRPVGILAATPAPGIAETTAAPSGQQTGKDDQAGITPSSQVAAIATEATLVREIRELLLQERQANEKPKEADHQLDEWKECRATIGRFDTILADLRKYGFSVITGLLTASTFLFAKTTDAAPNPTYAVKCGVLILMLILLFGLFVVDRAHEVFLLGAVKRATTLEPDLGMGLTEAITRYSEEQRTDTWGFLLYALFGISGVVAVYATTPPEKPAPPGLWIYISAHWLPLVAYTTFLALVLAYHYVSGKGALLKTLLAKANIPRRAASPTPGTTQPGP